MWMDQVYKHAPLAKEDHCRCRWNILASRPLSGCWQTYFNHLVVFNSTKLWAVLTVKSIASMLPELLNNNPFVWSGSVVRFPVTWWGPCLPVKPVRWSASPSCSWRAERRIHPHIPSPYDLQSLCPTGGPLQPYPPHSSHICNVTEIGTFSRLLCLNPHIFLCIFFMPVMITCKIYCCCCEWWDCTSCFSGSSLWALHMQPARTSLWAAGCSHSGAEQRWMSQKFVTASSKGTF